LLHSSTAKAAIFIKMNYLKILFLSAAITVGAGLAACKGGANTGGTTSANTPAAVTTPEPITDAGQNADLSGYSLATPTEAYQTALNARKNCDVPVLKRVMSQAMLTAMVGRGESSTDGKKTLDQMIKDLCDLPTAPNAGEIKDEKMVGDEATIKFKDETGEWRLMDLVRENGEWKITMPRGKNELPALK
jgi:hypothetical protein